jgi:two-component system response regulator
MEHLMQPIVLHVDDDPDDRLLVYSAIKKVNKELTVNEASSGSDAFNYLNRAKAEKKLPCLMILDMNMPGMTGKDVVEKPQKDDTLKKIPVILFTTSVQGLEIEYFKSLEIEMVSKPSTVPKLEEVITRILNHCYYAGKV